MGKGDRRGKSKPAPEMPQVAEIPRRRKCGRRREYNEGAKDPRKIALGARCRIFGVKDTPENRKALSGQHNGSQLGMVLHHECRADAIPRLWSTWQGYCTAMRTYRARILNVTGDPANAALQMMPEPMQADDGHTIDTRDAEQRDRDAVNSWMRWHGCIGHLSALHGQTLAGAERGTGKTLWRGGPTKAGLLALAALMALADIAENNAKWHDNSGA